MIVLHMRSCAIKCVEMNWCVTPRSLDMVEVGGSTTCKAGWTPAAHAVSEDARRVRTGLSLF
jgi:hypothetical protein